MLFNVPSMLTSVSHGTAQAVYMIVSQEEQMMEAREAIAETYKTFEAAFHRGDTETISLVYTEDAEWLVPQAPVVKGRQAIAQTWRGIIGPGGNYLRIETCEVQESGDWAYEVGRFEASAPDATVLNSGKYIVIWKRQATDEWKTHRDIFNWDIPPAEPTKS